MKIALVILHADPKRGGAERYTFDLAKGLAARGHEVSLLASSFGDEPAGARQVPLAADAATKLGGYLRFLDSLDAHLAISEYDIVHAMLPVRRCDIYHPHAGIAAEAVVRGHAKHDGPIRRGMAKMANQFNRKRKRFAAVERDLLLGPKPPVVLCLSDYIKATVRRHYPLAEERLARLFNAVDLRKFDPAARTDAGADVRRRLGIPAEACAGLIIAQDFRRKGLAEAIRALAGGTRSPHLVVVGKEDAEPYRALANSAGVGDRVVFAGSTSDPGAFYLATDFFVLPTRHDPCSLVVLEALAMGLPVISTVFNGACEIMTDGVHGFVLKDPTDVQAIRACYQKMMDAEARGRLREACLTLRPELSQERHLDRLIGVYASVPTNVAGEASGRDRPARP